MPSRGSSVLVAALGFPLALAGCSSSSTPGGTGGGDAGGARDSGTPSTDGRAPTDAAKDTSVGTDGVPGDGPMDASKVQPGFTKVGTGEYETLYLVDGVVYGYGGGSDLLGQGSYQGLCIPPRPIDTPKGLKFIDVQGGLHQSMAVDENGHVWTWGLTTNGLQGSGTAGGMGDGSVPYMITVDADGKAFDHVVAVEPVTAFDAALKDDGTVWVWGDCTGGVTGDGTASGVVVAPTKVPIPLAAGVTITKIVASSQVYALASDGAVWAWGPAENPGYIGTGLSMLSDQYTPHKVVDLPKDIVDIAVGYSSFSYALSSAGDLYGWGYRGAYLGLGSDADEYVPTPTPVPLKSVLNLPKPVVSVSCDFMTTHVILSDGTLWGWGDAAQGEVGDGEMLDFSMTTTPYAWDFGQFELMVRKPVQLVPGVSNFTKIFSNSAYDFYDYAMTADGKIYSWGRNKTGTLGNGVYGLAANGNAGTSSDMEANYPDSWNVALATLVTPMTATPMGVNSPYCVAKPTATGCD